jgi:aspartate aminotransferase
VKALMGKTGSGKRLENDIDLAGYLLEEARCAVVPGTAFGAPGFLRISYAASNDMIREGLSRIGEAVSKLT